MKSARPSLTKRRRHQLAVELRAEGHVRHRRREVEPGAAADHEVVAAADVVGEAGARRDVLPVADVGLVAVVVRARELVRRSSPAIPLLIRMSLVTMSGGDAMFGSASQRTPRLTRQIRSRRASCRRSRSRRSAAARRSSSRPRCARSSPGSRAPSGFSGCRFHVDGSSAASWRQHRAEVGRRAVEREEARRAG